MGPKSSRSDPVVIAELLGQRDCAKE